MYGDPTGNHVFTQCNNNVYSSNLSHKCFTGKVIYGRLDAITLGIVALLISSLLSAVTEQKPSYCMPQAAVITNSNDPVLQLYTSYIL